MVSSPEIKQVGSFVTSQNGNSADYDLGNNRKLTVAFGRDFDGTVSKSGNVIAALNFLAGFGNRKKVEH